MSNNSEKLKPCPFCGGDSLIGKTQFERNFVICSCCHATATTRDEVLDAITDWNHRTIDDAMKAEILRLQKDAADFASDAYLLSDNLETARQAIEQKDAEIVRLRENQIKGRCEECGHNDPRYRKYCDIGIIQGVDYCSAFTPREKGGE